MVIEGKKKKFIGFRADRLKEIDEFFGEGWIPWHMSVA